MGNNVNVKCFDNYQDAAKAILERDHPEIMKIFQNYKKGKLGSYFVPPDFISNVPDIVRPEEYEVLFTSSRKGDFYKILL